MQEKVGEQGRLISPCLKAGALRHILVIEGKKKQKRNIPSEKQGKTIPPGGVVMAKKKKGQQRIASKLTLYNLARVWYNKGTKCDDVGWMSLHQSFILSH